MLPSYVLLLCFIDGIERLLRECVYTIYSLHKVSSSRYIGSETVKKLQLVVYESLVMNFSPLCDCTIRRPQ
jgi:hypothetical protein